MYAKTDGQGNIVYRSQNLPEKVWIATSESEGYYETMDPADANLYDWYELEFTPKPDDTATHTHDLVWMAVGNKLTQVWNGREMTPEEKRAYQESQYPTEAESAKLAARLVVLPKLAADELDDETVASMTGLFPSWDSGLNVEVGEVYRWDGTLVEVLQAHTTQSDWTPDTVPALFKIHRAAGSVAEWVQPTGAQDAYNTGERVTYNGSTWESTVDANIYAPGVVPGQWTEIV